MHAGAVFFNSSLRLTEFHGKSNIEKMTELLKALSGGGGTRGGGCGSASGDVAVCGLIGSSRVGGRAVSGMAGSAGG
jgi:hypothetical protein